MAGTLRLLTVATPGSMVRLTALHRKRLCRCTAGPGRTCVGVRCKDGVVLGVEKLVESKLLVKHSNRRINSADLHVGVATAGLAADGRALVALARNQAEQYRDFYHMPIPGKVRVPATSLWYKRE